jgi:hypothetical protein
LNDKKIRLIIIELQPINILSSHLVSTI